MTSTPSTPEALEGEWECMECGYVEEGISTKRPTACPECHSPGTKFEFFESDDENNWEDEDWDDEDWDDESDDD